MKKIVFLAVLITSCVLVFGQDPDKALKYFENEQYELAAKEFKAVLPKIKTYFGKNDTTVYSKFLIYTGISYYWALQYEKSEKYLLSAKQIYEQKKGTSHWGYALSVQFLDAIYSVTEQQAKSSSLNESVFKALEVNLPKDLSTQLKILSEIRDKSCLNSNFYSAIRWTERIIELILKQDIIDYSLLVTELANCANYYHWDNQNEKALNLFNESLQIAQDHLEKDDPGYLEVTKGLGYYYEETDDYQLALQFLLEAKAIAEKTQKELQLIMVYLAIKSTKLIENKGII